MSKDSLNLLKLAQNYKRKNALSPICWILSVLVIASSCVFIFSDNVYINVFLAVLMVVAIIYFGKVYWYLLKNDPDRLHSEKLNF